MRWDFGIVVKRIRQAKGLTQQEVCGNFLSRTTLSKIEHNKEVPSLEKFEHILRQLDMSLAEFDYICHYYAPSERSSIIQYFENRLSTLVAVEDYQGLMDRCRAYLSIYQDLRIAGIVQLCELCVSICQHGDSVLSQQYAQKIWEDLEKCDTWYLSELCKLNAVLICFSHEQMERIAEKVLISLEKYRDFQGATSSQFSLLANMSTIFLHAQDVNNCLRVTQKAHEVAKNSLRVDQLGFTWVRLGMCQHDKKMVQKGLRLLREADLHDMANKLETEAATCGFNTMISE